MYLCTFMCALLLNTNTQMRALYFIMSFVVFECYFSDDGDWERG